VNRTVQALVGRAGEYLGAPPPFDVPGPWWSNVEPVTAHLDQLLGVPTAVLRLVHATNGDTGRGGAVVYHVEAFGRPPASVLDPSPRRL